VSSLARKLMDSGAVVNNPTIDYLGTAVTTTNASSYTYTVNTGPEDPDRYILIGIATTGAGSLSLTSITIDGNPATILVTCTYQGNLRTAFAHLLVPTGTSSTVVVTTSGTAVCMGIVGYSITGGFAGYTTQNNSATVDDTGTSFSVTHPTVVNKDRIMTIGRCGTGVTNVTWTNSVEDFDVLVETSQVRMAGGTASISSGASNYVITAALNASSTMRLSSVRYYA